MADNRNDTGKVLVISGSFFLYFTWLLWANEPNFFIPTIGAWLLGTVVFLVICFLCSQTN